MLKNLLIISALLLPFNALAKERFVISTGSKSGVYFSVGNSLCKIFNKYQQKRYECLVVNSLGAEDNLFRVRKLDNYLAISQAGLQYEHFTNISPKIRSVMMLHHEYLSIISKTDQDITKLDDLLGKRINTASEGSGSHKYFKKIMAYKDWKFRDFDNSLGYELPLMIENFCANNLVAAFYTVGHPNPAFGKLINECDGKLLSLNEQDITDLEKALGKEVTRKTIPAYSYNKQASDINTVALPIVLSASERFPAEIISELLSIVTTHKAELEADNPVFKQIIFKPNKDLNIAPPHVGVSEIFTTQD